MGKKLMVFILALILVPLFASCAGPAGAPGPAGPTGVAGPAGAPASAACIVVTPSSGKIGTAINITGAGFVAGETIELAIEVNGVENILGEMAAKGNISANDNGAFLTTSGIPLNTPAGIYALQARGNKGTIAFYPLQVTK